MTKTFFSIFLLLFLFISCSKDTATPAAEAFGTESKALLGTWKITKTVGQVYANGSLAQESIGTPVRVGDYAIQFTEELFQNTPNTKKVYDIMTGLTYGEFGTGILKEEKWSVYHKDSVAIGNYKYYMQKVTTTEIEFVFLTKQTSPNSYTKLTWFFTK